VPEGVHCTVRENLEKRTRRSAARLMAAGVLLLFAFWIVRALFVPGLQVRVKKNGEVPSGARLGFRFQPLDEPRLDELASREDLRSRVDPGAPQFQQILNLKDWVAAQWQHGEPKPYPPWDALIILDWIRSGRTGGFCGQYSQVFLQSLAALGFTARYVEIGSRSNPYAHYITEVWSNDFNKWIMMDVAANLHFERDHVPLSVLEIHDALLSQSSDIAPVAGASTRGRRAPADSAHQTTQLYYYVRFHLKADHLSAPKEAPFDRPGDMIEWRDPRVVPWERSAVASPFPKERLTRRCTADRAAIEFKLNQVHIEARSRAPNVVTLHLRNDVLQWQEYRFRTRDRGGAVGPWQAHRSETLRWEVRPEDRWLEISGVNSRGIAGPSAIVEVEHVPPRRFRRAVP